MNTSINSTTGLYSDDTQLLAGNLSHFKIKFKNRATDDHLRWPGTIEAGENMRKGVRYTIISVAEDDKNKDFSGIGYKDFSETNGEGGFYRTMAPVPDDIDGEIPRGFSFIANDESKTVQFYSPLEFPATKVYAPGDILSPGITYSVKTLGGVAADNDFDGQFASVADGTTVAEGESFVVADVMDSSNAAYEGNHFDASNFHADTRLMRGTAVTKLAFGSDYFKDGMLEPNVALGKIIGYLQTFASVVQIGPLAIPDPVTDPYEASFVVVLENWFQDPTLVDGTANERAAAEIRSALNRQIDADLRGRERFTAGAGITLTRGRTYGITAFDPDDAGTAGAVIGAWADLGVTGTVPAAGMKFKVPTVADPTDTTVDFDAATYGASSQVIYARGSTDADLNADVEVEVFELK